MTDAHVPPAAPSRQSRFDLAIGPTLQYALPFKKREGQGVLVRLDEGALTFITQGEKPLPQGALIFLEFTDGLRQDVGRVRECVVLPEDERMSVLVGLRDPFSSMDIGGESPPEEASTGEHRVLVVDDDPTIGSLLGSTLSSMADTAVTVVATGEEALEELKARPPHLVLLDINLPDILGTELLRRFKETSPAIEVIMITAEASVETAIEAVRAGAFDYLEKPFQSFARVKETVQHALERRRLRLENERLLRDLKQANSAMVQSERALRASHQMMILQEKVAALGRLSAGLAHEINNPLGVIMANLSVLEDILAESYGDLIPDVKETIDDIAEGSRRIQQVIADLRVFADPFFHNRIVVDMKDVVELVLRTSQTSINRRAYLDLEIEGGAHVRVHRGGLARAIDAVVRNALQSFGKRPQGENTLRLICRPEGEWGILQVVDNGYGIRPEDLGRIWDPFFTTLPVGEGMGLGLSMALSIVQDHRGTIEVESQEGRGTTMTIKLPLYKD